LKAEFGDIHNKREAIKVWADKNKVKLPIFKTKVVLASMIKGFEKRIKKLVDEILLNKETLFADTTNTKSDSPGKSNSLGSLKKLFSSKSKLNWENIRIELLSDSVISFKTINSKKKSMRFHYTELGMSDKRKSDMPNRLWTALIGLIEYDGIIPYSALKFEKRSKIEKTISDLRNKLKEITGLKKNPILFNKTDGYTVQFKVKDNRPRRYHSDID